MRLLEAIIDANHRAVAGDAHAGLHPADFESELPIVGLTCIDVRLNPLLPEVLGVPESQFIWLRNAGNIITGPLSSTMRSLALACAIKGGKEIAIIGHTDCQVGKTTTLELIERLQGVGVDRHRLPPNVNDFFGTFSSERANVIKAVDLVRQSPIIGPRIPVHGLLVDIETGRVDWLVDGYQTLAMMGSRPDLGAPLGQPANALPPLSDFKIGEIKFPDAKIGEAVAPTQDWLSGNLAPIDAKPPPAAEPAAPPSPQVMKASFESWRREKEKEKAQIPPKIPVPPPLRPKLNLFKRRK